MMGKVPLRMPISVKLVPGFQCAHFGCTARLFRSAPSAARHAATCIANPKERTCVTCEHDGDFDSRECQADARPAGVKMARGCAAWKKAEF